MRTKYRILDQEGDEIASHLFKPWVTIPVDIVDVTFMPNNDPDDPSEDELVMTLKYRHDLSDEEAREHIHVVLPEE